MTQIKSIMVTNGGSHPADKWADICVDNILGLIVIADDADPKVAADARQAKRDISPALFEILNAAFSSAQKAEGTLPKNVKSADDALKHAYALNIDNAMLDGVLAKVAASFAKTPFADHFAKPETQAVVRAMIGQCMADVIHIERRYHHDRLVKAAGA